MRANRWPTVAVLVVLMSAGLAAAGCFSRGGDDDGLGLSATIRWTSTGIPHVIADDWRGLGYGYGYAFARDNACVLAEEMVTVGGERSRHFGPEATVKVHALALQWTNLESDLFHTLYNTHPDLAVSAGVEAPQEARELMEGFVRGFNRHLAQTGVDGLPEPCRGADWVRPITMADMERRFLKLQLFASALALGPYIVAASPPDGVPPVARSLPVLDPDVFPLGAAGLGSNGYAVGRDATADGSGLLLGNPHFPWVGAERFHQLHLTIPGTIDVMGATLYGVPMVLIGFNADVAWTHTVSTARRFTFYELQLAPGDPTSYVVDGAVEPMQAFDVTVDTPDGPFHHTFWITRYGPIVEVALQEVAGVGGGLTWTPARAFTFRDANAFNTRIADQFLALAKARSVGELKDSLDEVLGIPWVNTIAVDRHGDALYADIGAVPNVPNDLLDRCSTAVGRALEAAARLFVLDGSTAACRWVDDPEAPQPGIMPWRVMPWVIRGDWVINSNDSHWLPNPDEPLEGYARIIGDEGTERSGRTRMGYVHHAERLAGDADCSIDPTVPCAAFTPGRVGQMLFSDRVLLGEMVRDDVVAGACTPAVALASDASTVDLAEACAVLGAWDLAARSESRGLILFERFWLKAPRTWSTPFDASDPVGTPRGYIGADPRVRAALADTVLELRAAGIALDASVGEARPVVRNDETIPLHGAHGVVGAPNMMQYPFVAGQGFTEEIHGSSYIQIVSFDADGPVAQGVLTYSQSTDPATPHYADQTRVFSDAGWVRWPFRAAEIEADLEIETLDLVE